MSDNLQAKFEALESQLATQNTALQATLASIGDTLGLINTSLETMVENAAINTKYLLAAIGANSPCAPCPTPPLTVPPTVPDENPINDDKCKRAQAFLHFMATAAEVIDTITGHSMAPSPSLVMDAIGQVITAVSNSDTTPLPSFPEAVDISGDMISFAAGALVGHDSLSSDLAAILLGARDALYASASPAAAQTAYNAVVDGTAYPFYVKLLLKALGYNALYSYYFDPASTPNLTGYDGTVCGLPSGCTLLLSDSYSSPTTVTFYDHTFTGYDYYHVIVSSSFGNENIAIVIDGSLQGNPYGDYEAYWSPTTSFRLQVNTGGAGGGNVFLAGCMGVAPPNP